MPFQHARQLGQIELGDNPDHAPVTLSNWNPAELTHEELDRNVPSGGGWGGRYHRPTHDVGGLHDSPSFF
jgi:hypothetical protein